MKKTKDKHMFTNTNNVSFSINLQNTLFNHHCGKCVVDVKTGHGPEFYSQIIEKERPKTSETNGNKMKIICQSQLIRRFDWLTLS